MAWCWLGRGALCGFWGCCRGPLLLPEGVWLAGSSVELRERLWVAAGTGIKLTSGGCRAARHDAPRFAWGRRAVTSLGIVRTIEPRSCILHFVQSSTAVRYLRPALASSPLSFFSVTTQCIPTSQPSPSSSPSSPSSGSTPRKSPAPHPSPNSATSASAS